MKYRVLTPISCTLLILLALNGQNSPAKADSSANGISNHGLAIGPAFVRLGMSRAAVVKELQEKYEVKEADKNRRAFITSKTGPPYIFEGLLMIDENDRVSGVHREWIRNIEPSQDDVPQTLYRIFSQAEYQRRLATVTTSSHQSPELDIRAISFTFRVDGNVEREISINVGKDASTGIGESVYLIGSE